MTLSRYCIKYGVLTVAALIWAVALSSCIADDPLAQGGGDPNSTIKVGASVAPTGSTRAYIPEGEVNDSTLFLIYNKKGSSSSYGHAKVDFGNVEGPTTGYAHYINDAGENKELKWLDVYGSGTSNATFYLTNIDPSRYTTYSSTNLLYWRLNNPIQAAPLDKKWGSNDILVGYRQANASTGRVDFTLDHILSLLKVNVEVYGADDNFFVDLDQAEVTISNLCRTTTAVYLPSRTNFTYNTSVPTSGSSSGYYNNPGILTLASPDEDSPHWETNASQDAPVVTPSGAAMKRYTTHEFVLAPQTIPPSPTPSVSEDGYTGTRPRLSIKVPRSAVMGGDVQGDMSFSGYIPEVMFELDDDGEMRPTPYNIALRSGYQLNITATINSPNTELVFAPVTIEPWVGKGGYTITTKQAGIYNEQQMLNMIKAYQAGDIDELYRYGYEDGAGNFVFQLWNSISLEDSQIRNSMVSEAGRQAIGDFCFLFNGYSFTLGKKGEIKDSDPILSGSEGQTELYNIVTGEDSEFIGVKTTEHLRTVFRHFAEDSYADVRDLSRYVIFNNSDNSIEVVIENVIDIPIEEVFQKLNSTTWGYTITFSNKTGTFSDNDGAHINALFSEEDNVRLPLVMRNAYDVLNKIVFISTAYNKNSINSAEEFYLFADVVNLYYRYFNDIITIFATYKTDNQKWNFEVSSSVIEIIGSKLFLKFVNDDDPGRPDTYLSSLGFSSGNTFNVIDDLTPFYVSYQGNSGYQARSLRPALDGSGTVQHLSSIITAYNSTSANKYGTLWTYGKFENGKWLFDMYTVAGNTWNPQATYEQAFGGMIVDEAAGKYDYEFYCGARGVTITNVQVPNSSNTTTIVFYNNGTNSQYPNDMKALKAMCNGTYWEYYEEWLAAKQGVKARKSAKKK